jgi:type IV pilus assembly protein PilA
MKKNTHAFTLVEMMIVVAIIALLAALSIPNLLRAKANANDAAALAFLKSISTALETYAAANMGRYPVGDSLADLASSDFSRSFPPYMEEVKLTSPQFGHNILFISSIGGYQIAANVISDNKSGVKNIRISTSGVVETEDCTEDDYEVTVP